MSDVLSNLTEMIYKKIEETDEWDDPNYASAYRSALADALSMIEEAGRKNPEEIPGEIPEEIPEKIPENTVEPEVPVIAAEPDFFSDDYDMSKTPYASEEKYLEPKVVDPQKRAGISNCPQCGRYIPYGTPFCPHCRHMLEWR